MRTLFFMILGLFLSACTPQGNSVSNAPEKPLFQGDVHAEAVEVYSKDRSLYACDLERKDKVLEISKAVEENRAQILGLIEKRKQEKNPEQEIHFFKWGDIQFYTRPQVQDLKDEWEQQNESWDEAYEMLQKIRNDKTHPDWVALNFSTRSLIVEDRDRIILRMHPGLRRGEGERVQRIFSVLDNCEKDPSCASLSFEPNDFFWLFEGLWHSRAFIDINDSGAPLEDRRQALKWLRGEMQWMVERYQFRVNPFLSVHRGELIVPINLKAFGASAQKIVETIEAQWSQHGLKVKLLVSDKPEAIEVFVKDTPGERPYVDWEKNQMVLFQPISTTTLVHEFGHVLGFRDAYYTSFDRSKCVYTYEVNPVDIMSNSGSGRILPSHIEQIKKAYGIKDVPQFVSPSKTVELDVIKLSTY